MKTKRFIVSATIGSVVYFLLGFIFYGLLLTHLYPSTENDNILFVFLGCMFVAILLAYVIVKKLNAVSKRAGARIGGIIAGLYAASSNFYMYSSQVEVPYLNMLTDILLSIFMGAVTGLVIALVNKKML